MSAFSAEWLALREDADASARATDLLDPLRAYLPEAPLVVLDLGCGTGSMARWLPGRLRGEQHWILQDRDPALLERASTRPVAADDAPVTAETWQHDITEISAASLGGSSLVTASALLDLLTAGEVERLAKACATAACPALLTLSVAGAVELHPRDPLDPHVAAAFNAHQRRVEDGRRLLGPDAVQIAAEAFARRGGAVRTAPSPWQLGPGQADLLEEWLRGWVGAACEQVPGVAAGDYLNRRLAACAAGELRVVVHHRDLLALPEVR